MTYGRSVVPLSVTPTVLRIRMANSIDVEEIDLASLTRRLLTAVGSPVEGYVVGRTVLRDAVAELLGCSLLEAENLVETLISRGWVVPRGGEHGSDPVEWVIAARD